MRKPWRTLAITLFAAAILVGGSFGDDLLALADDVKDNVRVYTELIEVAYQRYGEELTYKDLVYASIHGMLRSLDPHTSFLTRESYDAMREKQQSSFYGLGIYVGMRNGKLTVITPIAGTPGHRMGLRAGDIIHAIDGAPTEGMTSDEAISKLKGPKDTQVDVTIVRAGLDEPLELTITRAEIPQTTVQHAYMIAPDTGYLSVRDFSRSTGGEVARAIATLKGEGMKRLIFDLRGNGGGLLDQAIEVAAQFVPAESKIVETRGRIKSSIQPYFADDTYESLGLPLVVLVNSGSASASEIVAGAIQDHDVGIVAGEPTWGKGLVQTVYTLRSGGAGLAITTARYYTPAGRLIQRDYSSYWDYYTDYDATTTAESLEQKNGDAEVFHTDLGRKVYGGGGITPDYLITPEDLHPALQKMLARSTLFTFAVGAAERYGVKDESWRVTDQVLADLREYVLREEHLDETEVAEAFVDPQVLSYVRARLRFEIFTGTFGLDEGHRALAEVDQQIQAAFDHFDEANDLLVRRAALDTEGHEGEQRIAAGG
jgi:carboxyl-terminal processing protease